MNNSCMHICGVVAALQIYAPCMHAQLSSLRRFCMLLHVQPCSDATSRTHTLLNIFTGTDNRHVVPQLICKVQVRMYKHCCNRRGLTRLSCSYPTKITNMACWLYVSLQSSSAAAHTFCTHTFIHMTLSKSLPQPYASSSNSRWDSWNRLYCSCRQACPWQCLEHSTLPSRPHSREERQPTKLLSSV